MKNCLKHDGARCPLYPKREETVWYNILGEKMVRRYTYLGGDMTKSPFSFVSPAKAPWFYRGYAYGNEMSPLGPFAQDLFFHRQPPEYLEFRNIFFSP